MTFWNNWVWHGKEEPVQDISELVGLELHGKL
jgi:hypothetical protein